jgi:DNA-binding transcriptional ArsR family regulator
LDALANRKRLHILALLAASDLASSSRSLSFSSLFKNLGLSDNARPALVHHLNVLQRAGVVVKRTAEEPGHPHTYRVYKLTDKGWQAVREILHIDEESLVKLAKSLS